MNFRRSEMATTSEQFNIRWNNYTSVLQSVIRKLLVGEQFVDVTLACEGRSIKCHRVVLSACSTYFEKILTENPYPHLVIYLKDTKIWELQALVTFMYNGEVSVNQKKLAGLVKAAESLKIKGLAPETMEDPEPDKDDEEEFDLRSMAGIKDEQNQQRKEESLLRITKLQQHTPPPPPLSQGGIGKQQLKRKGIPALPKLVKMQKIDSPGKLHAQANGAVSASPQNEREPQVASSSTNASCSKYKKMEDDDDSVLHEFERAEIEDVYGEDFDGLEEDDFKDVEDDMEQIEEAVDEDVDGNSNEGQSTGSDNEEVAVGSVPGRRRLRYKYGKDIRDSALAALNSGVSLRQCSEAFSIPRKTLSKWKAQDIRDSSIDESGEFEESLMVRRTGQDVGDRAERLQKAMELAMSGTTVRQAAAHFDIPRTTLCAYMKRRGVAPKRNFLPTAPGLTGMPIARRKPGSDSATGSSNLQPSHEDDFPFLGGISGLMDGVGEQGQ